MKSAATVFSSSLFLISIISRIVIAVLPANPPPAKYGTLSFNTTGNVTRAVIDNPPINLVDTQLLSDLTDFLLWLQPTANRTTPPPKVVIFSSANEDFFMQHIDLNLLEAPSTAAKTAATDNYISISRLLQNTTSTIFIAEINGRAFGAGQELSVQMDMRFAGPNASVGSIEVFQGLFAGNSGQLFLGTLVNRGRALEYLLAGKAIDGPTGEAMGLFNTAYGSAEELSNEVDALANRIGLFVQAALNETKSALRFLNPTLDAQNTDAKAFLALDEQPEEQLLNKEIIIASNNETYSKFELDLPDSALSLYE